MSSFDVPTTFSNDLDSKRLNSNLKEWTDTLYITPKKKKKNVLKADYLSALEHFYCGDSEQSTASMKGKSR